MDQLEHTSYTDAHHIQETHRLPVLHCYGWAFSDHVLIYLSYTPRSVSVEYGIWNMDVHSIADTVRLTEQYVFDWIEMKFMEKCNGKCYMYFDHDAGVYHSNENFLSITSYFRIFIYLYREGGQLGGHNRLWDWINSISQCQTSEKNHRSLANFSRETYRCHVYGPHNLLTQATTEMSNILYFECHQKLHCVQQRNLLH